MTGLVMILLLVLNLAVVILGCFILKILPENRQLPLGDAFWESLKLILDPGGFLETKLSAVMTIVTSIIVLCGTITFTGGVIGYVTNIITATIENSKNGSKDIGFTEFTLILNWNEHAMAIILDYVHDARRDNKNEYIVILSEYNKDDLEKIIAKEIKAYRYSHAICNKRDPKIIVRNGNPRYTSNLDAINYSEAKAIYVMQIEGDKTPDFEVMQTCMAISGANNFKNSVTEMFYEISNDSEERETRIVVETSNDKTAKMLLELEITSIKARYYTQHFSVLPIRYDLTLGKIFAEIAINPSMSCVFQEILSQAGSEFVEYDIDDDTMLFDEEIRRLRYAIPIYDSRNGGRVYLAGDASKEEASFEYMDESEIRIKNEETIYNPIIGNEEGLIVVWGYNKKLVYILNSLMANNKDSTAKHCKVLLLASKEQEHLVDSVFENEKFSSLFVCAPLFAKNGYCVETLLDKLPMKITSFLVLSRDDYVDDEKDKEVFEVWMAIHHEMSINDKFKKTLNGKLILEVSNSNNAELLKLNAEDQVIISSELISLFMTQMSVGSTLHDILFDMICAQGDVDLYGEEIIREDSYDLRIISAKEFFGISEAIEFLSKQDLVSRIYYGTSKEYIPLGLIIDNTAYLFTNGGRDAREIVEIVAGIGDTPCMSDGYLVNSDGVALYADFEGYDYKNGLRIEPGFEMVVVHKCNGAG